MQTEKCLQHHFHTSFCFTIATTRVRACGFSYGEVPPVAQEPDVSQSGRKESPDTTSMLTDLEIAKAEAAAEEVAAAPEEAAVAPDEKAETAEQEYADINPALTESR